jgi:DNA mismatch repair ATPase MutL
MDTRFRLANWLKSRRPAAVQTKTQLALSLLSAQRHHSNSVCCHPHRATAATHLTPHALATAVIIGQVDSKYIALFLPAYVEVARKDSFHHGTIALIDQHAAHERVRFEHLSSQCHKALQANVKNGQVPAEARATSKSKVATESAALTALAKLSGGDVSVTEVGGGGAPVDCILQRAALESAVVLPHPLWLTFQQQEALLQAMGITVALDIEGAPRLVSVPVLLGVTLGAADAASIIEQLRSTPQLATAHCTAFHSFRRTIAGKACRGAVMFNQRLGAAAMTALVKQLAATQSPFQCAHGRPAGVPVYRDLSL